MIVASALLTPFFALQVKIIWGMLVTLWKSLLLLLLLLLVLLLLNLLRHPQSRLFLPYPLNAVRAWAEHALGLAPLR